MDSDELRYSTVHYEVRRKLGISFADYIFLDMVHFLSGKYGKCFKSTSGLATDMGLSFNGVKKMIERMIDRELLVRDGNALVVTQSFIDLAYFNKTGIVPKIAQSATSKKIALSSPKLHKVHKIAQSSDKNKELELKLEYVSTNIETAKPGNSKINDMFDYWTETIGYAIDGQVKKNRFACSNLLKKHGEDGLKRLISGVALAKGEQYAPDISDFCELQAKANKLVSWGHRRSRSNSGGVVTI